VVGMGTGAVRLLLLAVLSVGVIGMHTVGHASDHTSWQALSARADGHAAATAAAEGAVPRLTDAADPCHGGCGTVEPVAAYLRSGLDPAHGGAGLVVVCLAVLFGLGVLAMIASAVGGRGRAVPRTAAPGTGRSQRAVRGLVPGFALRVVDVAVLRT
jgi:hypothetical protein